MADIPENMKLEPCPFCGVDDAKLVDATRILGSWKVYHRCKTVGYLCVEVSDRDRAIADWNCRADRLTRQDPETIRQAALEEVEPTHEMLAAGWAQLKRAHHPWRSLGPGPGLKEAYQAMRAIQIRALKEAGHG